MANKMPKEMCRNCKFFIQHYILTKGKFKWINRGHCTNGKLRDKHAFAKACQNYEYQEPVEDRYVDKEYLSKELLQKVLTMDLLPKMDIKHDNEG